MEDIFYFGISMGYCALSNMYMFIRIINLGVWIMSF